MENILERFIKPTENERILYKYEKCANKWTLIRYMLISFIASFLFLFPLFLIYIMEGGKYTGKDDYVHLIFAIIGIYSLYKFYNYFSDYLKMPDSLIKYYKYLVFTNKGIHSNHPNLNEKVFYPWDNIEQLTVFDTINNGGLLFGKYYLRIKFNGERFLKSIDISKLVYSISDSKRTERCINILTSANNSLKAYKKTTSKVEKDN